MKKTMRIAEDLAGGLPADAQKASAVRVLLVAADPDHLPVLDLDPHPAQGGVTVHRTHGPDDAALAVRHD
jgi:hypothetical protein